MDVVAIEGARIYGRHGITPEERSQPQPIDVTVRCELDLSRAQQSDALGDTLDYDALHKRVVHAVTRSSYALLERLAADLLAVAFDDPRVLRAEVTLQKPHLLGGATPSVTLRRERSAPG